MLAWACGRRPRVRLNLGHELARLSLIYLRLFRSHTANVDYAFQDPETQRGLSPPRPAALLQVRASQWTHLFAARLWALISAPPTPASPSWSPATPRSSRTPKVSRHAPAHTNAGQRTTPSVVAFTEDGTRLVGDVAKRQVSSPSTARTHLLRAGSYLRWAF